MASQYPRYQLVDLEGNVVSSFGGAGSDSLNLKFFRLTYAPDLAISYTYLDAGTADERINTITYSSTSLAISGTETYTYEGVAGAYRVASIARS